MQEFQKIAVEVTLVNNKHSKVQLKKAKDDHKYQPSIVVQRKAPIQIQTGKPLKWGVGCGYIYPYFNGNIISRGQYVIS